MEKAYRFVGKDNTENENRGKVTGGIVYIGDMDSRGMLHIAMKGSTVAHGKIRSIDCKEAERIPGVVKIYTYLNTPDTRYDRGRVAPGEVVPNQERLFDPHVRFLGERVAAVAADSYEAAAEACRAIRVEYEELPAVLTMEEAKQEREPLIHQEGNELTASAVSAGDYEKCDAECSFKSGLHIGRMSHLTIETVAARACWDRGNRKLTIWAGTQTVFGIRSTVADFLGLSYSKVRVIKAPMGGSFGVRQETLAEPLVAYVAWDLKADVKLVYTREEQFVNTTVKQSLDARIESKVTRDGKILGLSVQADLDAGAYHTVTPAYARTIGGKLGKVYQIPNIQYVGKSICTNTVIAGGFRSWGTSEAALIMETHWNWVARQLKIDPIEFRLRNILEPYSVNVMSKSSIGSAKYRETLLRGRDAFDWEERRKSCREKNDARYRYGVGMALTTHTSALYPAKSDYTTVTARFQEDGSLVLITGVHDIGSGAAIALKKIAAEVLTVPLEQIELREADSELSMYDYGCYASRSVYVIGEAVEKCCRGLFEQVRRAAAAYWHCSSSLIRVSEGMVYRETLPDETMTLAELTQFVLFTLREDLYEVMSHRPDANPHVAAAHFSEVRVDTFTGAVKIVDCLSVHDVGKIINPQIAMGQVGSGIQQGIGIALCEDVKVHPASGQVLINNLKNYEVANAGEMPAYRSLFLEDPEEGGPFGAKSLGEVVVAPVPAAVVAAVNDALDTNLTELPLTRAVIMEALEKGEDDGNKVCP